MARPVAPRRAAVVLGAMALAGAMLAGLAPAAGAVPPACREHLDPQPDHRQRQRPRRLRLLAAVTGL